MTREHEDNSNHGNGAGRSAGYGGLGHNHPGAAAQWQTRHGAADAFEVKATAEDFDKVESAFVEGFMEASDPTSFLRLAGVPFEIVAPDGANLRLLRVEIDAITDVGSVTPHVGGASFRYDPMPATLVSRRRRLGFIYFDGSGLRRKMFAELRRIF